MIGVALTAAGRIRAIPYIIWPPIAGVAVDHSNPGNPAAPVSGSVCSDTESKRVYAR